MGKQEKLIGKMGLWCREQKEFGRVPGQSMRFEVLALRWLANTRLRIKESSYVKYSNVVYNHLIPELGNLKIRQLTTERIEGFVNFKLQCGKKRGTGGLSEKSVRDIMGVLKEIFRYAGHWNIEVPCRIDLIRIRRRENAPKILSRTEQGALEESLFGDDSLLNTGIMLSLYMGLRLGEVCALRRHHILYEEEILQVRETMQRIQNLDENADSKTKIVVTEPKSSSSRRDIPIPMLLFERLEIIRDFPETAYILTGSKEEYVEPRTLENTFKRCLKECEVKNVNYHALRHTFATRCIENGVDAKTLSELLGHANVNITLDRYVHSSMEQKRAGINKLRMYK